MGLSEGLAKQPLSVLAAHLTRGPARVSVDNADDA